jgi:hypothetical protein
LPDSDRATTSRAPAIASVAGPAELAERSGIELDRRALLVARAAREQVPWIRLLEQRLLAARLHDRHAQRPETRAHVGRGEFELQSVAAYYELRFGAR